MEEFAPILMLLFFWIVIGIPVTIAKKAAEQKKGIRPAVRKDPAENVSPSSPEPAQPERLTTLTPSISVTDHDDSVYQGSLNAFTGEGYDPCHEEQLLPLTAAEESEPHPAAQKPRTGLPLGWTGNDVVRGIVMSEILNRKR